MSRDEAELQNDNEKQKFGEPLNDFSLQKLGGGTISLSAGMEGKRGAVVVFWSGVCSHCVRYDKYFNAFEQRHPELALVVLASRHGETMEAVQKTVADRKLKVNMAHDPGGVVAFKWFTQQTPRAFLMDAERRLLYRGAIDNYKYQDDPEYVGYLEPAIGQFLAGEAVGKAETASFGCAIQSVYYILPKAL